MENQIENFFKYFTINTTFSKEIISQIYRLRYDVYCQEFNWEKPENFLNQEENDRYDDYSIHCACTYKKNNTVAGCVRIITNSYQPFIFPFEKYIHYINDTKFYPKNLDLNSCCEISRLAVSRAFRRRAGEKESVAGSLSENTRIYPMVSISLMLSAIALSLSINKPNGFSIMEKKLAIFLSRIGINFLQISDFFECKGTRAVYYIDSNTVSASLPLQHKEMYDIIYKGFVNQL